MLILLWTWTNLLVEYLYFVSKRNWQETKRGELVKNLFNSLHAIKSDNEGKKNRLIISLCSPIYIFKIISAQIIYFWPRSYCYLYPRGEKNPHLHKEQNSSEIELQRINCMNMPLFYLILCKLHKELKLLGKWHISFIM